MTKHLLPLPGAFFEARYPFVRDTFTQYDGDGPCEMPTWKPGTRAEYICPDDTADFADGIGSIILTVVAVFKPGRYPTRVFYTRRWCDPSGREFGNGKLRIATVAQFYILANGYRHDYEIATPKDAVAA